MMPMQAAQTGYGPASGGSAVASSLSAPRHIKDAPQLRARGVLFHDNSDRCFVSAASFFS